MMNEIRLLASLEFRGLYGFNKFRYTKDKKSRYKYMGLAVCWLLLAAMVLFYAGGLTFGIIKMGLPRIVVPFLTMTASLVIFFFGLLKAGNMIFSKKGYDSLCSFPIRPAAIVISRFLAMYAEDLALAAVIFLPGAAVYGYCVRPDISFYLAVLAGLFFVPMLPLVVSVVLGTLIAAVSSRMKQKTMVQTILTLALVLAVTFASFAFPAFSEEITLEMLADLAGMVARMIGRIYPPAVWLGDAAVDGSISSMLLFAGTSVLAAFLMVVFVAQNFHRISRRLLATSAKHNYRMRELKSSSILLALCRREAKRYFASSIYVTNTIVGPILACAMCVAILIAGMDKIRILFMLPFDLEGLIPFAVAAVFGMMTTTSTSISMEGKQFWIVKTLPVSVKTVLDSKILLNLGLMLPFYLVSEVLLVLALRPDARNLLWLILIPALLIVFAVVAGISVNLRLYSFDWEKEETVVKQSASAMIGGFAGMLTSVLCGALIFFLPKQWGDLWRALICAVVFAATALLYYTNNKVSLNRL